MPPLININSFSENRNSQWLHWSRVHRILCWIEISLTTMGLEKDGLEFPLLQHWSCSCPQQAPKNLNMVSSAMFSCLLLILFTFACCGSPLILFSFVFVRNCYHMHCFFTCHELEERPWFCASFYLLITNLLCKRCSLSTDNQSVEQGFLWESGGMVSTTKMTPLY
jgi:hypothetical protein